jgi:hypothetical protein
MVKYKNPSILTNLTGFFLITKELTAERFVLS